MSPEALAFSVAREEIEQLWTATGCPLPGRSRRVQRDRAKRSGTVAEDHAAIAVLPGRARRQGRASPPSSRRDPAVGSAAAHSTAGRSTGRLTGAASDPDGARPRLSDWRGSDLRGFDLRFDTCMPCSFWLLPHRRSGTGGQPNGPLRVTVIVRQIPLVTAAGGTRVARPARTTMLRGGDGSELDRMVRPVLGKPLLVARAWKARGSWVGRLELRPASRRVASSLLGRPAARFLTARRDHSCPLHSHT
jgi:hypothetical protein